MCSICTSDSKNAYVHLIPMKQTEREGKQESGERGGRK